MELENACKEVAEVKTELQTVRHKLDRQPQSTEKENILRGPVPKQLKVCANFCSSTVAIGVSFFKLRFWYGKYFKLVGQYSLLCDVNTACHMACLKLSRE